MSSEELKSSPYAPLIRFYEQEQLPPLEFNEAEGDDLPQPQRHLLVHSRDMTTRLERYHRTSITLKTLYIAQEPHSYFREVLLIDDNTGKPVEYGAIEIHLEVFPEELRQQILEGHKPLGGILVDNDFPFISETQSYFSVQSDKHIQKQLELSGKVTLHGRANLLCTADGETIANIVEILPNA